MQKKGKLQFFLGVVALGCVWGFFEAVTFLGLLHSHWGTLFRYHLCPCFLMAAVLGSFVMGLALSIYKRPDMLVGIGLVAAAFCWFAVPFLPTPVRSTHYGPVVSSAMAAVLGSLSLALVTAFFKRRLERNVPTRIGVGTLSGIFASIIFILVTAYGVDKPICADLGYARPLPDFLGIGGMVWMVAQAIMFPLGYMVGEKLCVWLVPRMERKPSMNYAVLTSVIAFCFVGGAIAFMIGF